MNSAKIYVGNLPYKYGFEELKEELRSVFVKHGEITDVFLIKDRETGKPRGFGFVTFAAADAAKAALAENGTELGGRPLRVSEAEERTGGGNGGAGGGGGRSRGGDRSDKW